MGRLASFGPVELKDGAITQAKLAPGALSNQTVGLIDNAITTSKIAQPTFIFQHFSEDIGPFRRLWAPSEAVRNVNDAEKSTTSTTPVKVKEMRFNEYAPKIDIYFELRSGDGTRNAYAQIYLNGTPIGTLRQNNSSTYKGYDEILGPFYAGDLLQIYAWIEPGNTGAYVRYMRLCYSYGVTHFYNKRLASPLFFSEDYQAIISVTNQDPA
jgi:hypothetical protein